MRMGEAGREKEREWNDEIWGKICQKMKECGPHSEQQQGSKEWHFLQSPLNQLQIRQRDKRRFPCENLFYDTPTDDCRIIH